MPLDHRAGWASLLCASVLTLGLSGCAKAQSKPLPVSLEGIDYRTLACPKTPPTPFTGALTVESKYDQSDVSKSTLREDVSTDSKAIQAAVTDYTKRLVVFSDYYLRADNPRQAAAALACLDRWLTHWAQADALTTRDVTKTGVAVRKWALAAMASVVVKMERLTDGQFSLNEVQRAWFARLADIVIEDYSPRLASDFRYFNNHDHWAALAVARTGQILQRADYGAWAGRVVQRAYDQVHLTADGQYGYWPNELARAELAANYMHYALVPLVLLAESAGRQGLPALTAEQEQRLQALANFSAQLVLDPGSLKAQVNARQQTVAGYRMAWLIPFLHRYPDHRLARALYQHEDGDVDGYSQIGGRLKPLYGMDDS